MSAVLTAPMTIAEFEAIPDPEDGSKLELVRGEVVVMPSPQGRHGIICAQIVFLLLCVCRPKKLGWVASNDSGVILERDPDTLRGPDVAFYSIERQPTLPDAYFEIPPDLAVEVLSPSDRRRAVREKVMDYLTNGVSVVWVVDPDAHTVTVYSAGSTRGTELGETDTLTLETVLPGFVCPVADLFN